MVDCPTGQPANSPDAAPLHALHKSIRLLPLVRRLLEVAGSIVDGAAKAGPNRQQAAAGWTAGRGRVAGWVGGRMDGQRSCNAGALQAPEHRAAVAAHAALSRLRQSLLAATHLTRQLMRSLPARAVTMVLCAPAGGRGTAAMGACRTLRCRAPRCTNPLQPSTYSSTCCPPGHTIYTVYDQKLT